MVKISSALNWATHVLKQNEIPNPRLDAEVLLGKLIKKDRLYLLTYPDKSISFSAFYPLILKRVKHVPVSYLTGNKEFMGHDFNVNVNVLIPRPDSEVGVIKALEILKNQDRVLDLCCGSGCLGISLALEKDINLTLSDISNKALKVCQSNLKKHNITAQLIESDLFENLNEKFNLIICNPPYISEEEYKELEKDLTYEPKIALVTPEDGLFLIKRIIKQAKYYLNGYLLIEIGSKQKDRVVDLFQKNNYKNIQVINDLAGRARYVIGIHK